LQALRATEVSAESKILAQRVANEAQRELLVKQDLVRQIRAIEAQREPFKRPFDSTEVVRRTQS
jgi:hypothetical protein